MPNRARLSGLILILLAALSGAAFLQAQESSAPERPLYVIQPDDVLEIFVWEDEALTRKVRVRPDGRISLPLVQDLMAAGSTPSQLKALIEEKLKEYNKVPNVTVIVDEIKHYTIYVTGKVRNPGAFNSTRPLTVLQALSLAGGFAEFAGENDIRVVQTIRLPDGSQDFAVRRFEYDDVVKGKKISQNIVLRPGDVVVVP